MKRILFLLTILLAVLQSEGQNTKAKFPEIYKRQIPSWFNESKFGIFVVWGPYSVPAWCTNGNYAEWYWKQTVSDKTFHERVYGANTTYQDLAKQFKAELWDPDFWCKLFAESGAKYVITTANFHDGFAMYPTKYAATQNTDEWNSMVIGPKRDIIGEMNTAGEKLGLKMGIYYSLYEWFHPLWLTDKEKFATEWLAPKFKEVVTRYKPWHIFLDGEWEQDYSKWKAEDLAYWLYNESPVKDYVVVNDRWGICRGQFGDVYESEYGGGQYSTPLHPWQEDRGLGKSYGFNRAESIYDYDSREKLLRMLSDVVGGGGNFLLAIGPTGDGRIPVIMQERLLQVGEWLKVNGEAVYGSTASPFWPRMFDWGTISEKPGKLYLHIHNPNQGTLRIKGIKANVKSAVLLHKNGEIPVKFKSVGNELALEWSSYLNDNAVTIIKLNVDPGYQTDNNPRQSEDGSIKFNCWAMNIHGKKAYANYDGNWNCLRILNWIDPNEYVTAEFIVEKPGTFELTLLYDGKTPEKNQDKKNEVNGKYTLQIDNKVINGDIKHIGTSRRFPEPDKIGNITIDMPGKHTISIRPVDDGTWNGFMLHGVEMELVKK